MDLLAEISRLISSISCIFIRPGQGDIQSNETCSVKTLNFTNEIELVNLKSSEVYHEIFVTQLKNVVSFDLTQRPKKQQKDGVLDPFGSLSPRFRFVNLLRKIRG